MIPLELTLTAVSRAIHAHRARCPVEPHALLAGDLGLDAIDRITVACALDEAFGIELPDAEIEAWHTVADIARSVEAHHQEITHA